MSDTAIDTSRTIEIPAAPGKLMMMVLGSLAFVVLGYLMSKATQDTPRYSASTVQFWGWAAMAAFGFLGLIGLWRLLTQKGPVITFSPQGLRDVRVSQDVMAWPAIVAIGEWEANGQKVMVVKMHPGEEEKLRLTTIARMSRGANARLGADGLAVTAAGVKMSHANLMATTIAYARTYGDA